MKIGFIGGGVMAEALISGIRRAKLSADITVGEPVEPRRHALTRGLGVDVTGDNRAAIKGAELVVLSVKPQQLDGAARELSGALAADQTVLSILAGVKMHSIGLRLNHKNLIRVMPNTPAQIGLGMSVWTSTATVPAPVREFTGGMLTAIGEHVYVEDEKYVDMATALSASGPAYVFVFIESLVDAAVQLGMPNEMARKLVLQTLMGSAALVKATGKHPAELRNMVTSPGGTTASGLLALENAGFRAVVIKAVLAAYERGEQLGSGK
ncbi:MAG: pyrroline-5-carboxylate reductase [SAR202 cluster bacterium]|nr:pyrroline-5-carboxylate reductase [SAR202 cluster bacterium]